jgi:nitroimidazol reductase NimA-like FMN-containing flavoprotein (pyridoxamine 5'-phosphate oxidase superfamily)
MHVEELTKEESLDLLDRARAGRLACARENQPFVVPVSFVLHRPRGGDPCLYGFTTPGQKVDWIRAHPRVCVEWDEVSAPDGWTSVVVLGRYEELTGDDPEAEGGGRELALRLLGRHALWWEPGTSARAASARGDRAEAFRPVYYGIHIDQVTGHRAVPGPSA